MLPKADVIPRVIVNRWRRTTRYARNADDPLNFPARRAAHLFESTAHLGVRVLIHKIRAHASDNFKSFARAFANGRETLRPVPIENPVSLRGESLSRYWLYPSDIHYAAPPFNRYIFISLSAMLAHESIEALLATIRGFPRSCSPPNSVKISARILSSEVTSRGQTVFREQREISHAPNRCFSVTHKCSFITHAHVRALDFDTNTKCNWMDRNIGREISTQTIRFITFIFSLFDFVLLLQSLYK